jgi:hypothetical protein
MAEHKPIGKTAFGVIVWQAPVTRPGRTDHLAWGGPGDHVRLHTNGQTRGLSSGLGEEQGTVGGPCQTVDQAQAVVNHYWRHVPSAAPS